MSKNIVVQGYSEFQSGDYDVIDVMGAGLVCGNLQADVIDVNGSLEVNGNISASSIDVLGGITCKGVISTQTLEISGGLEAEGLLAKSITMNISSYTSINHISAEFLKITINHGCGVLKFDLLQDGILQKKENEHMKEGEIVFHHVVLKDFVLVRY
ncbi:polymer-forming cytoskeletal protein [Paenibacillus sp. FSL R7-0331]|uniref:polymer-forming cytoskeletal protein n=1 Tax=Paenibacillus sp. FSL R7-0331 TaxID=1536773 RepID=UPI0004F86D87|nr:polymer-forming cytoskeletal protein [Paenibacillus sp. FSL R7-0331]AIQ50642.1 hypothetical protein R70331_03210 [Paenibacillus sp. FSL R7-0331]